MTTTPAEVSDTAVAYIERRRKHLEALEEIDRLRAEIEQLRALLSEARDDIHDEVANRYPWKNKYPQDMLRYERDMDIVRRIDAALAPETKP